MKASIMAHLVASYPTAEQSLVVARALIDAGVSALEIQFPYSDPTADGPAIQEACGTALRNGFRARDGFDLVSRLASESDTPIFIMTYGSMPYTLGIPRFSRLARDAGATGLIVPDLPPDCDEGLYGAGRGAGLAVVPVLVPTASEERIAAAEAVGPEYIYCALRTGTTGSRTEIGDENLAFLERIRKSGAKVMAGFGVQARDQVEALAHSVEYVVVGSAIVRTVAQYASASRSTEETLAGAVRQFAAGLVHGPRES